MRTALSAFAFAAAVLAGVAPAFADWQYTRWRMTAEEVVAASSGAVRPVQGSFGDQVFDLDLRARGSFRGYGMTFDARFFFTRDEGRLAAVKLIPDNNRCDALERQLLSAYGAGERSNIQIGHAIGWTDSANGDSVLFADIGPVGRLARLCHVIYRPLPAAAGESG